MRAPTRTTTVDMLSAEELQEEAARLLKHMSIDEVDAVAAVTAYAKELEVMPTIQGSSELEADTGGWPGWLGVWLGCCGASRRSLRAWHHHLHCLALAPPWHPASVRPAVPSGARASLSDDVASSRDHSITSGLEGQRRTAGATTSASRRSQ